MLGKVVEEGAQDWVVWPSKTTVGSLDGDQ